METRMTSTQTPETQNVIKIGPSIFFSLKFFMYKIQDALFLVKVNFISGSK